MDTKHASMRQIRAIIFDFGGVLVRMVDNRARMKLAEQLGLPLYKLDDLIFYSDTAQMASRGEIPVDMHWKAVRKLLGIKPEDMPGFLAQYWSADDVNWKLLDYIRSLRPRYKIGLLSNAWDDLRKTLHACWNIDGLFDELIISTEVKLVKPNPHIFHLAVERLGVQSGEAVFIDDIKENVDSARREGLIGIQCQDAQKTIDELDNYLMEG